MIIRASFENVLSFNKETSISFVASKSDLLPAHVFRAQQRDDISILKTGLIYGANGSGKSNIIKCIESLCEFAVFGKSTIDEVAAGVELPVLGKLPIDLSLAELADAGDFAQANVEYLIPARDAVINFEK